MSESLEVDDRGLKVVHLEARELMSELAFPDAFELGQAMQVSIALFWLACWPAEDTVGSSDRPATVEV